MASIRETFCRLLERGADVPSWQVRAFCAEVLRLEAALWTFATAEGVEPTNNAAGPNGYPALRLAGLWRKGCFGVDSTTGNEFVARILTVAATCRQQQRDLLAYLTDAVVPVATGIPPRRSCLPP